MERDLRERKEKRIRKTYQLLDSSLQEFKTQKQRAHHARDIAKSSAARGMRMVQDAQSAQKEAVAKVHAAQQAMKAANLAHLQARALTKRVVRLANAESVRELAIAEQREIRKKKSEHRKSTTGYPS